MMRAYLVGFLVILSLAAGSQKLQYSRQTAYVKYPDAMQLIANIAGYHHLLAFTKNKKPAIYIFDNQLKFLVKHDLPFKLPENADVKLIPVKNFYYLYSHVTGSTTHELWRINKDGISISLTEQFETLISKEFLKMPSALQLSEMHGHLVILANTYFRELQKVATTVVSIDSSFNIVWKEKVSYDFQGGLERLQQVNVVSRRTMLVMKSTRGGSNNTLDLIKINFDSSTVTGTTFSSFSNVYSDPAFVYNVPDSSITVYSMITGASGRGLVRSVFISQLDNRLQEKVPVTVLKTQFRNNTYANFLLIQGKSPRWIGLYGLRPLVSYQTSYNTYYQQQLQNQSYNAGGLLLPDYRGGTGLRSALASNLTTGVRFSLLNSRFQIIRDSLVANDKPNYNIEPQHFARFYGNNKSYLLLSQHFKGNRRGLLMVEGSNENEIETTDIRVNDRYEFMLNQLQQVSDGAVIVPYVYRREAGLLKLSLAE